MRGYRYGGLDQFATLPLSLGCPVQLWGRDHEPEDQTNRLIGLLARERWWRLDVM
jgi:hypothetical protein